MPAPSGWELLIILLLSGTSTDIVSLLEPSMGLESLGVATDEASLQKLLEGTEGPAGGSGEVAYDKGAARTAIQNLASSSEAIRKSAREKLAGLGPAVRGRLEDVVQSDPRRAEEARMVLKQLGASEKSSANRATVARLLAVRLAGDLGLKSLSPAIRKLVDSPDPFLRNAARDVLASLEGKEPPKPPERPWLASLAALEALPTETRIVLDARVGASPNLPTTRVDRFLEGMSSQLEGLGAPVEAEMQELLRTICQGGVDLALTYGNARIDRISMANVAGVGPLGAGLGIIVFGEYQRTILEQGLEANTTHWSVQEVEGKKVFTSLFVRLVPLDDHKVLVLPQQASVLFPLADYLKALREGKKPLRSNERWEKFLGTLDGTALVRVLAITDKVLASKLYEALESEGVPAELQDAVKGMREVEADVRLLEDEKLSYRTEAAFESAKQATILVDFLKGSLQEGIQGMEGALGQMAGTPLESTLQKLVDVLKRIRVVAEGKRGILRGDLKLDDLMQSFVAPRAIMEG